MFCTLSPTTHLVMISHTDDPPSIPLSLIIPLTSCRQSGRDLVVFRELAHEHVQEAEAAVRQQEGRQVAAGHETRAQLERLLDDQRGDHV